MTGLTCSVCGAEMNRHAEKPVHTGEVVLEIHACPGCGNLDSVQVPLAGPAARTQDMDVTRPVHSTQAPR